MQQYADVYLLYSNLAINKYPRTVVSRWISSTYIFVTSKCLKEKPQLNCAKYKINPAYIVWL